MNKCLLLCLFFISHAYQLTAQELTLSGVITDSSDGKVVPFAHVSVTGEMTGTIANDSGEFEIKVPDGTNSIVFTAIGYKEYHLKVTTSESELVISLDLWSNQLEEAIVMPRSAKEYIMEAIKRHSSNITHEPFTTQSYFSSSNIMENKGLKNVKTNEAVFLTFYPNYADTSFHNQNRLLLHQFSDNGVEVDVSMIDNKKVQKKKDKMEMKQAKRDAKNAEGEDETSEVNDEPTEVNAFAGGKGPDFVLSAFQNISGLLFLNKSFIEDIEFSIGSPSYYGDRKLITIDFKNEKPIMLMFRFDGTFYLDSETLAIVAIDYTENVKIPAIFRPLIKAKTGVNIVGFENEILIQNQLHDSLWFPQQIVYNSKVNLKQGKAFRKDEHLYLSSKHILSVEKVDTETAEEIIENQQFDGSKKYEEQLFPLENLNWDDVNVVN
ncbi:MAG: carboxypeptidase-like regulatory domain-containing protein [Flavobacteriales bacterium]